MQRLGIDPRMFHADGAATKEEPATESTEVQWDIQDKGFAQDAKDHQKLGLRVVVSQITVRFHLYLKTKEKFFELFMESLHDRDLELDLEVRLEFLNYKRTIKGIFNIIGRNEKGQYQPTSLFWDNLLDISNNGKRPEATVHIKFNRMMSRCSNYPKPRFVKEQTTSSVTACPTNSLADDMWRAFLNETGADCTITCESFSDADQSAEDDVVEQRPLRATFRVQKAILVSRSEVFSVMFSNQFSENENNTLHITDMSPQALREMLRFLYTDKMLNANLYAKELLMAANKYNIPRMQLLAEEALCSNLSDETVLEVARFASLHNGNVAKNFAINCIVSNFSTIIKREEWRTFVKDNLDLIHEIHLRLANKLSSQNCFLPDGEELYREASRFLIEPEFRPRRLLT